MADDPEIESVVELEVTLPRNEVYWSQSAASTDQEKAMSPLALSKRSHRRDSMLRESTSTAG